MRTRIRGQREIDDISGHIIQEHALDEFDRIRVARELLRDLPVRHEVTIYLDLDIRQRLVVLRDQHKLPPL